jgi:hypothetical protein
VTRLPPAVLAARVAAPIWTPPQPAQSLVVLPSAGLAGPAVLLVPAPELMAALAARAKTSVTPPVRAAQAGLAVTVAPSPVATAAPANPGPASTAITAATARTAKQPLNARGDRGPGETLGRGYV